MRASYYRPLFVVETYSTKNLGALVVMFCCCCCLSTNLVLFACVSIWLAYLGTICNFLCNYQYFIHISLNLFPVLPKLLFDVTDPCHSKRCPLYAQCVPQSRTFAVCVCPSKCRLVYDPTCGTDQKSYFNLCALQLAACQSNSTVSAAYKGTCGMKISSLIFSLICW